MEGLEGLLYGFTVAFTLQNLLFALLGAFVGTMIGVLPGIGPALTIALLLPMTYGMPVASAFILFAGIYYGAMYGGSTTSILLKTPGESGSIVAAIDGNMMARAGRGAAALATASRRRAAGVQVSSSRRANRRPADSPGARAASQGRTTRTPST